MVPFWKHDSEEEVSEYVPREARRALGATLWSYASSAGSRACPFAGGGVAGRGGVDDEVLSAGLEIPLR